MLGKHSTREPSPNRQIVLIVPKKTQIKHFLKIEDI
jgi:hypothetical protein